MASKGWRYACLAIITLAVLSLYGVLLLQDQEIPSLVEQLLILLVGAWIGAAGTDIKTR